VHGTKKQKHEEKPKTKNRVAQKKPVRAIVREGSPGGKSETTRERFVICTARAQGGMLQWLSG